MTQTTQPIKKLSDQTFILDFTIRKIDIQSAYQNQLKKTASTINIQGFRPGKAPLSIVEQNIDLSKLINEIVSPLVSNHYQKLIKKHQLKPVVNPRVELKNPPFALKKNWQIQATACQLPQLKLNPKYKSAIKKINQDKTIKESQKTQKILQQLEKNVTVDLPKVLIESELQKKFEKFVHQLQSQKISLDNFLKNKKIKFANLKKNFQKQIQTDWSFNLSLNQIAKNEKLTATQQEIKNIVQKHPHLGQNIHMAYYLVEQQKVLDFLKKL